jgi:hypothetical protein
MVFQVIGIMYLTVFDISSLVKRIFSLDEVDTFSTSVSHIPIEEGFYLKITLPITCCQELIPEKMRGA